ncbi:MAG: glycosyltransferase family 9 protein, partial [Bacteroidetes bacterium]
GDIILTTPFLRVLRKKYPVANIDFICKKQFADAVRLNPNINSLLIYDDSEEFKDNLLKRNYDWVIDLQNNFRSRKLYTKLNAKVDRFKKPSLKKFLLVHFKSNLLTPVKPIPERYFESVDELISDFEGPELFIPKEITPVLLPGKNYIGICPGSQHYTKQYPVEYQIELCNKLLAEGFTPVLFGGKSDLEICKRINEKVPETINLSNDNDLFSTAANMKLCKVIICNDSGLMHTAAALKIPLIAIFGSTVKEFGFIPYGTKNVIIENEEIKCRPCSHIGRNKCPKAHFDCMMTLTPQLVFDKFKRFYDSVI